MGELHTEVDYLVVPRFHHHPTLSLDDVLSPIEQRAGDGKIIMTIMAAHTSHASAAAAPRRFQHEVAVRAAHGRHLIQARGETRLSNRAHLTGQRGHQMLGCPSAMAHGTHTSYLVGGGQTVRWHTTIQKLLAYGRVPSPRRHTNRLPRTRSHQSRQRSLVEQASVGVKRKGPQLPASVRGTFHQHHVAALGPKRWQEAQVATQQPPCAGSRETGAPRG